MSRDIPQIDNCCDKEAYAFFGLAAYMAQVLEHGAINLALAASLPEVHLVTRQLFEKINTSLEKQTFGQLLTACKKAVNIPQATSERLTEALELRNMLAHRYFRERAEEFMSEAGRQHMKEELQVIIGKLHEADNLLEAIYLPILAKYGVTQEFMILEMAKMQERAKAADNGA